VVLQRGIPIEGQRDSDLFAVLIALIGADGPTFNNQVLKQATTEEEHTIKILKPATTERNSP